MGAGEGFEVVGVAVGTRLGSGVGLPGLNVGRFVGTVVGVSVGFIVGTVDGLGVGG